MKTCSTCGKDKPFEDFSPAPRARDGRAAACRDCANERSREIYALKKADPAFRPDRSKLLACLRCATDFVSKSARHLFCSEVCAFWAKVDRRGPDECWEWTTGRERYGYGHSVLGTASRVAWELTNGPIPDGQRVLHSCDNPPCCNPRHLFLGTQLDNVRDMMAKGRHRYSPNAPSQQAGA